MKNHWQWLYWAMGALGFTAIWLTGWGPHQTRFTELLTNLAASAAEMLLVQAFLKTPRFPLAAKLAALVATSLATGFWASRATPSGAGVEVAHVLWLMVLVVVVAGGLGWDLFTGVLERDRPAG